MKNGWFQKLEEELLEDILAPLHTMIDRLKGHIGKKTEAIADSKKQIEQANQAILKHEDDRTKAITALNNISALFEEKSA